MIEINENDLPITVAQKLITAKRKIADSEILCKALNRTFGGNETQDAFTDDELMEIADYLLCYCKHQGRARCGENEKIL